MESPFSVAEIVQNVEDIAINLFTTFQFRRNKGSIGGKDELDKEK